MADSTASQIVIRPPVADDRPEWERLYRAYAAFYKVPMTDEILETVWTWIHDPKAEVSGFVAARPETGKLVGLTHYRKFSRPLKGSVGLFLDDLFTDPEARGGGVGRKLIDGVADVARRQNMTLVRWITADDNHQARMLYDQVADRTMWVTYDLTPE